MKIKVLLCNCRGLDKAFADLNTRHLTTDVSDELAIDYTILHPELCGDDGSNAFNNALRDWDDDTYIICGACAPEQQGGYIAELARSHAIPEKHLVSIDIRNADNDMVVNRLRLAVEGLIGVEQRP